MICDVCGGDIDSTQDAALVGQGLFVHSDPADCTPEAS